uniref:Uncharacterized protein n=1 Tax=Gossypium raimondii TaxID=29730 RepID=A0A0D2REG9_GOSRA|nr:hypothetical protein B456_005G134700 [Gossypium raimondii]
MLTILAGFSNVSIHPPPAFGSSPNLEALALEANKSKDQDGDSSLLDSSHLSRYLTIYLCLNMSLGEG